MHALVIDTFFDLKVILNVTQATSSNHTPVFLQYYMYYQLVLYIDIITGEGIQPQRGDIKALQALPHSQPGLRRVSGIERHVQHYNGQISSFRVNVR